MRYLRRDLRADAVAGLTVAVMGVPQAMAYALIAGLPPVFGLYTAIVSCLVGALLGSSRHLVTGPTNASCMVILSLTAPLHAKYGVDPIEAVLLLTLMTGAIQLGFGLLRFGGVVRYVSNSVVVGFTAGAGILIAANQLKNIFGIELDANLDRFYEVVLATIRHVPDTNPYALAVGLGTIALVVLTPKLGRKLPAALIAVAATGFLCWVLGWDTAEMGALRVAIVRDIEPIAGSLPPFHLPQLLVQPHYELTRELGIGALALSILGLVEAASISRAVAASSGQRLDFTKEFIGQGTSKIVGAFFLNFASSGSFTRTAVCYKSGGRTRMAAMFSAGWTALALVVLGPVANQIPQAALAGLLIVIAYSMIDKNRLLLTLRSGRHSRQVVGGTLGATLILPIEYAIFVGVSMSLLIVLRATGKTDLTQLVPSAHSGFEEVPFNRAPPSPVVTVNMAGDLYFAAAEDLDHELLKCLTSQTRVVVLRMKRLRAVGSTAMAMLEHLSKLLRERGVHLVVCGIEPALEKVLTGSGLRRRIGEQNIFYADNRLLQSLELALARAWSIVEVERRTTAPTEEEQEPAPHRRLDASTLMSARAIRFGNQHQLREAVWLMSEMHKHFKSLSPQTLFLQDREAKLGGELSPWRLLEALASGASSDSAQDLEDKALGEEFRRDFTRKIREIARTDLPRVGLDASLAELVTTSVDSGLQTLPICDDAGRIKGLVSSDDLLRGLQQALGRAEVEQA